MMIFSMIGILLFIMMFAIFVFASRYVKVPPNKALVVYGHATQDGSGMAIYTAGGRFIMPIVESFAWLDLSITTLNVNVIQAVTKEGVMLDIEITAQSQIDPTEESLKTAAMMLIHKTREEIDYVVQKTLEGHTRGVCASLALEDFNVGWAKVSEQILKVAVEDLMNMGISIVSFVIRGIGEHDPERYRELKAVKTEHEVDLAVTGVSSDAAIRMGQEPVEDHSWEVKYLNEQARVGKLLEAYQIQEKKIFEMTKRIKELELELGILRDRYNVRDEEGIEEREMVEEK